MAASVTLPRVVQYTELDLKNDAYNQDQPSLQIPCSRIPPLRTAEVAAERYPKERQLLIHSQSGHAVRTPSSSTSTSSEQIDICSVLEQPNVGTTPNVGLSSPVQRSSRLSYGMSFPEGHCEIPAQLHTLQTQPPSSNSNLHGRAPYGPTYPMSKGFKLNAVVHSNNRLKRKHPHESTGHIRTSRFKQDTGHARAEGTQQQTRALSCEEAGQEAEPMQGQQAQQQHLHAKALSLTARQMAAGSNSLSSNHPLRQSACGSSWHDVSAEQDTDNQMRMGNDCGPLTQTAPPSEQAPVRQPTPQAAQLHCKHQDMQSQHVTHAQQPKGQMLCHDAMTPCVRASAQPLSARTAPTQHNCQDLQQVQGLASRVVEGQIMHHHAEKLQIKVPVQRPTCGAPSVHSACQDLQSIRHSALPLQNGRLAQQQVPSCSSSIQQLRRAVLDDMRQEAAAHTGKLKLGLWHSSWLLGPAINTYKLLGGPVQLNMTQHLLLTQ